MALRGTVCPPYPAKKPSQHAKILLLLANQALHNFFLNVQKHKNASLRGNLSHAN